MSEQDPAKSTPDIALPQSGPMSRNSRRKRVAQQRAETRTRERALVEKDPSLMMYVSFRAWLKQVMTRATFKVVFACALFVASTFAWHLLPTIAVAASCVGSVSLGAVLGAPCDVWWRARMKRLAAPEDTS